MTESGRIATAQQSAATRVAAALCEKVCKLEFDRFFDQHHGDAVFDRVEDLAVFS